MKIELGRDEIAEAIEEYVRKKVVTTLMTEIEITQSKAARATVVIKEPNSNTQDAG